MRLIYSAILCATFALPGAAQAQAKKVSGASAAGLCASALDFVAGARSAANVASPEDLNRLGQLRDLFINLGQFQKGEVEGYANAWSDKMNQDLGQAQTAEKQSTIVSEITTIAVRCQRTMIRDVNRAAQAAQGQAGTPAPQAGTLVPQAGTPVPQTAPAAQPFTLTPQ